MGRIAEGWHLSWPPRGGGKPPIGHVRFTFAGGRVERSTGQTDKRKATAEAARIYAVTLAGGPLPSRKKKIASDGASLVDLTTTWLAQLPNPAETVAVYEIYAGHWVSFFRDVHGIGERVEEYTAQRLKSVIRKTVLKELSKLRGFLAWAKKHGHIQILPLVPVPEKASKGVRHNPRRKIDPVPISEKEAAAVRKALPELGRKWKGRPRKPRAFFTVLWETGLRPITVHRLEVGRHYVKGGQDLTITADIDKVGYARTVSLTPVARAALDGACPKSGVIFPRTDYRKALKLAGAKAGLPPEKVAGLTRYDFRHGRTTSLVRSTGNLLGTAQLVGHTQVSTTNRYLHPDREAGDKVIAAIGRTRRPPKNSGAIVARRVKTSKPT